MEICIASESDALEILEVIRSAISENSGAHYSDEQIATWAGAFNEDKIRGAIGHSVALVVTLDKMIIGFGNLIVNDAHIGELDLLYVSATYQRKGVGKLLIRSLENEAKKQGLLRLSVDASAPLAPLMMQMGYNVRKSYSKLVEQVEFLNTWVDKNLQ